MSVRHSLLLASALLFSFACNETANTGDGGAGDDFIVPVKCENGVDPSTDIDSAIDLTEGVMAEEYLCPQNDKDYYKVVLPEGKKLLRIQLRHRAAVTPVQLTYRILKRENGEDVAVTSAPDVDGNQIDAYHFLQPGTYYVLVEDKGNDDADGKNTYQITFSGESDKDTNEDNNTEAEAKALTGTTTGYISFTEDKDFFSVNVTANQLLRVRLSNENTTTVDLQYVILKPGGEEVARYGIDDGTRFKTELERVHHLPSDATTYYVVVMDKDGDESDLNVPYTLDLSTIPEPDANDQGGRNDHPTSASVLGSFAGTEACANPKTFTVTGYLASHADVDYFRIDAPATLAIEPVIDIDLKFNGASDADLSVSLLLPKADTTCSTDNCCRVLGETECDAVTFKWHESGNGGGDDIEHEDSLYCINTSFSCIERGAGFCAECVQNPGGTCPQERGCAGAVACLPSGNCAYQQFNRYKFEGAPVNTAQPVRSGGPFYLRVSDFASDEYETGVSYSMTVKVCANPDGAREPDNRYFPHFTSSPTEPPEVVGQEYSPEIVKGYMRGSQSAMEKPLAGFTIPTDGSSWSPYITGTIAYQYDEDHYTFANPCPDASATGAICLIEAQFQQVGSCPSDMQFHYWLDHGRDTTDFPKTLTATSGTYGHDGGSKCAMLDRSSGGFALKVADILHNAWSTTCQYQVRFRAHRYSSCPQPPCQTYEGQCYGN